MSWDDYGYRARHRIPPPPLRRGTHDSPGVYGAHIHGRIGYYGPELTRLECLVYALLGRRALVRLLSRRRRLRP